MIKRRDLNLALAATAAMAATALAAPGWALAQGGPIEGKDFTVLKDPVPPGASGKVEVIEFFGYWCPHCSTFEPALDAWARKLPADVNFRRIPVAFSAAHEGYQKLYFAIESMGQVEALHAKVFLAIHAQHQRLDKDTDIAALANANGVDGAKLLDAMKSFSVATKINQARQLAQAYRLDGVPTLAVNGRFTTSVSQAGGPERTLAVADVLIQRSRKR